MIKITILFILDHGTSIGKKKDRFLINFGMSGKPSSFVPANRVEGIVIDAKTSLSSGAFDLIMEYGIPVSWSNYKNGMMLIPFNSHGTVSVRREQYMAREDERGNYLAHKFVHASCNNRLNVLRRLVRKKPEFKERSQDWIDLTKNHIEEFKVEDNLILDKETRQKYLNHEAKVAKTYYAGIREILSELEISFERRSRRPAGDIFNALLNYANAILKTQLSQRITITGLDIFGGFLHVDRSGRESLILDLMEEFRQYVVDETVLNLVISEQIDLVEPDTEEIIINKDQKSILIKALFQKLNISVRDLKMTEWILFQARKLCRYLQSDEEYTPFLLQVNDPW